MLNWTTIDITRETTRVDTPQDSERLEQFIYKKTHHPILGEQPPKTNNPDPFTAIDEDELCVEPQVSAVNCSGEVFAKEVPVDENPPTGIISVPF
jgi:hypothetical protein